MSSHKHCILVIDDAPMILRALGDILKTDYNVLIAKSGEQGIASAKKNMPDIILLDVMMPGMTGFEVIEALKADETTQNIPVIFITGDDSHESKEKGYQLGAVDYIEKPFVELIVKKRVEFNVQFLEMNRKLNE